MREPSTDPRMSSPDSPRELEEADLVEEELLVEDVSIDGMCGVY